MNPQGQIYLLKPLIFLATLGLCILYNARAPVAEELEAVEEELKAAFTLNFLKFSRFQDSETSSGNELRLCVVGAYSDSIRQAFTGISGRTVNNQKIHVSIGDSVHSMGRCKVVYCAGSCSRDPKSLFALEESMITIGEGRLFAVAGGTFSFVIENKKLRFYVNRRAAKTNRIEVSSKLLKLAKEVLE